MDRRGHDDPPRHLRILGIDTHTRNLPITPMASWFKQQKRRLEQGILEQLGAASSSKDDSFTKDQAR